MIGFQPEDFRVELLEDFIRELGKGAMEDPGQRSLSKVPLMSQKLFVTLHHIG